jgi:hypothetical protein
MYHKYSEKPKKIPDKLFVSVTLSKPDSTTNLLAKFSLHHKIPQNMATEGLYVKKESCILICVLYIQLKINDY